MPVEVIMPKVDMDMASGVLATWHVQEGDAVAQGAPLFDIETDKAAMEVEAPGAGRLHHILAKPGDRIEVGTVIAWLYADGEAVGAAPGGAASAPAVETSAAPAVVTEVVATGSAPAVNGQLRATPLARRLARENGMDLSAVPGTGPNGRVQKDDVVSALRRLAGSPAPAPAAAPAPAPGAQAAAPSSAAPVNLGPYADRPHQKVALDGMRRTIAQRLTEAKQTVPHFYLRRDVRLDRLLAFRAELNEDLAPRGIKLSVNDYVIKACALALQQVPEANAIWAGDEVLRFERSDVAVAVAVEGGLFTPVIRDADLKSLSALSAEMKALAAKARDRKLVPSDYQGGSFSISNLGMFGIENFDAIINPPQAAILAVGAATERAVVGQDRQLEAATVMSLTLSVDHRVIDGALGATLLDAIRRNLEAPRSMLA